MAAPVLTKSNKSSSGEGAQAESVAYLFLNPVHVKAANSQDIIHWHVCVLGTLDPRDAVDGRHPPLQPLDVTLANLDGY